MRFGIDGVDAAPTPTRCASVTPDYERAVLDEAATTPLDAARCSCRWRRRRSATSSQRPRRAAAAARAPCPRRAAVRGRAATAWRSRPTPSTQARGAGAPTRRDLCLRQIADLCAIGPRVDPARPAASRRSRRAPTPGADDERRAHLPAVAAARAGAGADGARPAERPARPRPRRDRVDATCRGRAGDAATSELRGPDAVTGLAPGQVLRAEPRPDSADVEPNYFPFVELAAPDLPWLLTPAAPGRRGPAAAVARARRRARAGGRQLDDARPAALPVLRIEAPAAARRRAARPRRLVGLGARAVARRGSTDVAAAVAARHGRGRRAAASARAGCCRDAAWLACLVPAFDGGVARGLGEPRARRRRAGAGLELAAGRAAIELPVYHSLALHDGRGGRLRGALPAAAARRRRRRVRPARDGRRPTPGLVTPAPRTACCSTWRARCETPGRRPRAVEADAPGRASSGRDARAAAGRRGASPARAYDPRRQRSGRRARRSTARGPPA